MQINQSDFKENFEKSAESRNKTFDQSYLKPYRKAWLIKREIFGETDQSFILPAAARLHIV